MIIVKLKGGLGNQLFQYAVGRSLSCLKSTDLKLDVSFFSEMDNQKLQREYVLDYYNIAAEVVSKTDFVNVLRKININRAISRNLLKKRIPYYKENLIIEQNVYFDKNIFNSNKNAILDGYWPNEKYFNSIHKVIRDEYTLKKEYITPEFTAYKKAILHQQSVSIHIRRADYLQNENYDLFGVCGMDYYNNAVNLIKKLIGSPVFYIFTDDTEWVRENFKMDDSYQLVSENRFQDYEELQLMSFCKHNIIANSTFSWWGAWLNHNSEKKVIAPLKWYNNTDYQNFYETSNFIPSEWIKL